MAAEAGVILTDLHHSYGRGGEVLRGVDLAVPRGGILALLGLNGGGKTTLLRLLMGLIRPTAGGIEVLGRKLGKTPPPPALLARVGYVPERPFPAEKTSARGLLAMLRAVHPRWDEETVARYLGIFHIPLDAYCRDLSAGTKSQLALTLAMAGRPELLILDEPTLGLDPLHRHQYLQFLLRETAERDLTILLTSHDLHQIERMADTVAILHQGRIVVHKPLDDLKERVKRIRVGVDRISPELTASFAKVPGVIRVLAEAGGYLLTTADAARTIPMLHGIPGVQALQAVDLNLEEIFLAYVEDGGNSEN